MSRDNSQLWLEECLSLISGARVTVFGDFCVDAYWELDTGTPEVSIETGLPVHRVRRQRYSLGGAGNVAANLAALGVGHIAVIGLIGRDPFGRTMRDLLAERRIDDEGMLDVAAGWQTPVYAKPLMSEAEQNRLDFGAFNELDVATMDLLAEELARAAANSDVVVLNQQLPSGVSPPLMIERINGVVADSPRCRFIVDARHRARLYRGAMLKVNAAEAARLCDRMPTPNEAVPGASIRELAAELHEIAGRPVFITRGEEGIIVVDEGRLHAEPAVSIAGPIDAVGAGDTVLATLAAVLASGGTPITAARLAMLAAAVTIQKLNTTGTATPDEIRAVAAR